MSPAAETATPTRCQLYGVLNVWCLLVSHNYNTPRVVCVCCQWGGLCLRCVCCQWSDMPLQAVRHVLACSRNTCVSEPIHPLILLQHCAAHNLHPPTCVAWANTANKAQPIAKQMSPAACPAAEWVPGSSGAAVVSRGQSISPRG